MDRKGNKYGIHRVISPGNVLPQAADRIDNRMDIYDNEILIDVDTLNIDAASFTQMKKAADGDPARVASIILETVAARGKQHNPVTGSGGMCIGRVAAIGPELAQQVSVKIGQPIATLVSLSLTPLHIEKILDVKMDRDQVDVIGQAVLFERTVYHPLPPDLPQKLSLAVLDVAGAPAQTAHLVKPGQTVLIIGAGGKSGMLCAYEARKRAGISGTVIGTGHSDVSTRRLKDLGFCDRVLQVDASNPLALESVISEATGGAMADVTINCVNIPNTEMGSILATKNGGTVYFFSMATDFTKAALGAEGVGSDVTMIIGNGYTRNHAAIALNLLRESPALRAVLEAMYGG